MSQARGRAYKCLNCGHTNEKRRVISHIYKEHVRLDEAPFYCKVCLFRCTDEESLRRHVRPDVYSAHHQRMTDFRMQGTILEPHQILMRSLKPKHLEEGLDYLRLTAKESERGGRMSLALLLQCPSNLPDPRICWTAFWITIPKSLSLLHLLLCCLLRHHD